VPRWPGFFCFPLRGGFLARRVGCLSALARPRSRRAETPEAATQQCGPGRGPPVSANDRVTDTPPRIRTLGTPWPPERWPPHPPGGFFPHPPRHKSTGRSPHLEAFLSQFRGFKSKGGFSFAVPRVADHSGAHGHRTREPCWGDGGAVFCERRGAPARIALSDRGQRSLQTQGAGAPQPADGHRGTGNKIKPHAAKRRAGPAWETRPPGGRQRRGRRVADSLCKRRPHSDPKPPPVQNKKGKRCRIGSWGSWGRSPAWSKLSGRGRLRASAGGGR
jgi:hypothetical protein